MSVGARVLSTAPVVVHPSPPGAAASRTATRPRPGIRLAAFTALAAYGLERWATLLRPAPGWRLAGLLAVAVALAGGIPLLSRRSRAVAAVVAPLIVLLAFPVAGLRWHWLTHLRVAAGADRIGHGLAQLPNVLVPYLGAGADIRLVIVLGAAVLVLDAAAVLAFGGRPGSSFGDGRRAAAALPLTALAIVPSTLIRPQWPYVQGLILFVLLAAFLWGERVRREASALLVVVATGLAAAILAPHVDQGSPWVDYRAWAGSTVRPPVDTFDWNQTYGPLRWPRTGHEVLTVSAATGEYWKAQDLDTFNGYAWVQSPPTGGARLPAVPALPAPAASARARWTQTIQVTIEGMQTEDVIAAGAAEPPTTIPGGVRQGSDAGTWVAGRVLGPGTTYRIATYSPHPSTSQLAGAGRRYPAAPLAADLTLAIPEGRRSAPALPVRFPLFHAAAPPRTSVPQGVQNATALVRHSPYAGAYALARRLAATAATPVAFVHGVLRYLGRGFTYNEDPPVSRWPLEGFLFSTRQGYCQQFSGAMAMLLRMGGVPARVATGFTSGSLQEGTHRWVVTDTDAHAWVEAWFPRYGWVRFDPTPASAPARSGPSAAALQRSFHTAPTPAGQAPRREASPAGAALTIVHRSKGDGSSPWLVVLAVILTAAAGLLLWRVRPGATGAQDLVDELERALARTRRPLGRHVTLAGLERRLASAPDAAAYVRALRLVRYGGAAAPPTLAQRRALRRELARGLGLAGWLRALWALPPRRVRRPPAPPRRVPAPPATT